MASIRGLNKTIIVIFVELIILGGVLAYYNTLPPNNPPIADAGADKIVFAGYPVKLDASGSSDPDGDEITYHWTLSVKPEESLASLSNTTVANPIFTP